MPRGRVRFPRFQSLSTYPALALGVLIAVAAARPAEPPAAEAAGGFAVRSRDVISLDRVRTLTALPGETVRLEVVDTRGSRYVARPAAGRLVPLGTGWWAWTAPPAPGLYPIEVVAPDGRDWSRCRRSWSSRMSGSRASS